MEGEPLLNFKAIEYALEYIEDIRINNNKDVFVWLCTNGSIYNEKWFKLLDKYKVRLGMSIDGKERYHNINRIDENGIGTYTRIMKNYNKIRENSVLSNQFKDILGLSVISEGNNDIINILKHYKDKGFKSVQLKIIRKAIKDEAFIKILKKQYKDLAMFLIDMYIKEDNVYLKMIMNDNDTFGKILKRIMIGRINIRRCTAGNSKITICPNGNIYPCDSFVGNKEMIIGNINDESIFGNFKNYTIYERSECKKCSIRYLCGGDCYFNSYINTGNIYTPDEKFCSLNKTLCNLAIFLVVEM